MSDEIADIIDDAIDLIETRGHTKRALQSKNGNLCLVGALNVAIYGTAYPFRLACQHPELAKYAKASTAILDAIHRTGSRATTVYGWNDYQFRTVQEVLDVGRAAAKQQRLAGDEES